MPGMTRREVLAMTINAIGRSTVLGLLALLAGSAVKAETTNCTPITSLPATINSQGVYCLTGHLTTSQTSGNAIYITAPNVVLDLNGWKVGGQGAGKGTTAIGIFSSQLNVTIKNGIVRGFQYGISLYGAGAVVEDILADQNTAVGIKVAGDGSIVRRNQVVNTGGSTASPDASALGIMFSAPGALIEDNAVSGLYASGSGNAIGILAWPSLNSIVRGNTVSGLATPPAGIGIFVSESHVTVVDNVVSNFDSGIQYGGTASGIYARNVVDGCTTKYTGGTAGSGND
jgi:hypothetical protein